MTKTHNYVRTMVFGAILASISVVLKTFLQFETPTLRITFYDVPLIFAGITLGPLWGGIVGFIADISKISIYGINLFTLSSILWGLIPGIVFIINRKLRIERINKILLLVTIILTSIICFSIDTYQLYLFMDKASFIALLPIRLLILVLKWPCQFYFIYILYDKTYHMLPKRH